MSVNSIVPTVSAAEQQGPSTPEAQKPELRENLTPEEKTFYGLLEEEYVFLTARAEDDKMRDYFLELKQACVIAKRCFEKEAGDATDPPLENLVDANNTYPALTKAAVLKIGNHIYRTKLKQYRGFKFTDTSNDSDSHQKNTLQRDLARKEIIENELSSVISVMLSFVEE